MTAKWVNVYWVGKGTRRCLEQILCFRPERIKDVVKEAKSRYPAEITRDGKFEILIEDSRGMK